MATIIKRNNNWQVKIRRKGFKSVSKSFKTKVLAQRWAREIENEMDKGVLTFSREADDTALADITNRYLQDVVPLKRSYSDYLSRINLLTRAFGNIAILRISSADLREFRDLRLDYVTGDTAR